MDISYKFILDKRRKNKDGNYPLKLRVYYNRNYKERATGIVINEKAWNEEQHYYPHGMVIEGAQQGGAGIPENQYLFQGNKLQKELDLFVNNFNFRQYDAQIGRFMAIDPLATSGGQDMLNPYQFCFNDPGNVVDPSGLLGYSIFHGLGWIIAGPLPEVVITPEKSGNEGDGGAMFVMFFDGLERQGSGGSNNGRGGGGNLKQARSSTKRSSSSSSQVSGQYGGVKRKKTNAEKEAEANAQRDAEMREASERKNNTQKALDNGMILLNTLSITVISTAEYGFTEAMKTANDTRLLQHLSDATATTGRLMGFSGLVLSYAQGESQGWQASNYVDFTVSGLSMVPGGQGFGILYFGMDLASRAIDGVPIGDQINYGVWMYNMYQRRIQLDKSRGR